MSLPLLYDGPADAIWCAQHPHLAAEVIARLQHWLRWCECRMVEANAPISDELLVVFRRCRDSDTSTGEQK
jgi:hypothetical protein